jgi:integrase
MRARKRGAKIWYYYDAGGKPRKEIPLGSDYAIAVKRWSELEIDSKPLHSNIITFRYVAERYFKEVVPAKALNTQRDDCSCIKFLYQFFDNPPAPLENIEPIHIRQFLDWRGNIARANRDKKLFSHIWNKAREWGYTALPNPCTGIRGKAGKGRKDVYITDKMYAAVYEHAAQPLRDAMDLAYLTGQRPSDVLKMTEQDIQDGHLHVTQNKTGAKIRISIEGELSAVLSRIMTRKAGYKVRSLYLIIDQSCQPITIRSLEHQFQMARGKAGIDKAKFQFRDLRSKAATDKTELSGDIREAQKQLGHSNIVMTEHYIRGRIGEKVKPTK